MAEAAVSIEKSPGAEFPSGGNQGVEDQDTATTGLPVDGEINTKSTENAHDEPRRSESGDTDGDTEEVATFELCVEDSKDLLSLNEELSSILDPKVGPLLNRV